MFKTSLGQIRMVLIIFDKNLIIIILLYLSQKRNLLRFFFQRPSIDKGHISRQSVQAELVSSSITRSLQEDHFFQELYGVGPYTFVVTVDHVEDQQLGTRSCIINLCVNQQLGQFIIIMLTWFYNSYIKIYLRSTNTS